MASYGRPAWLDAFRELVARRPDGGFTAERVPWSDFAPPLRAGEEWRPEHADLASTVQRRLEEVLVDLARWVHERTGERALTMAGGVALNCVANSRIWRETPFEHVWVQPASGDSGTALGAALRVAATSGTTCGPWAPRRSGAAGATRSSRAGWSGRASCSTARTTSARRWPSASRTTGSSPGSRAGPSSARARSAIAPCSPTRAIPPTSSASTTSRGASSSGPWRPWSSPRTPRRCSRADPSRAPTCSSRTTWPARGARGSPPWSTWTGRRASRRSTATRARSCTASSRASRPARGCPWWSTPP
jgi:hypothetical protein